MGRHAPLLLVLPIALALTACDRGGDGEVRVLRVRALPLCNKGVGYARPVVVRIDRDAALFEEKWSNSVIAEGHSSSVTIPVLRKRMKATVRLGFCAATSLATWDCTAASWQWSQAVVLDARADVMDLDLPPLQVPCADGTMAHRPATNK